MIKTFEPHRLDDEGHALCGCGGKARVLHLCNQGICTVDCSKCYVETGDYDSEDEAWAVWDKAIGGKDA